MVVKWLLMEFIALFSPLIKKHDFLSIHVSVKRAEVSVCSLVGWSPDDAQLCAEVVVKLKMKDRTTYR